MNNQGKGYKSIIYAKYYRQFKGKSNAEKKWLICQIKNAELVEIFLDSYCDMIECYANIYENDQENFCKMLYKVLMTLADNYTKCDKVSLLQDEEQKKSVVLAITDPYVRSIASQHLSLENQRVVLATISDEVILKEAYLKTRNSAILCAINDDMFKMDHLRDFWFIEDQVKVICSFSNDEIKYSYTHNPLYENYLYDITMSFKEFRYKYRVCSEHLDLTYRLRVAAATEDNKEFNDLLNLIPDSMYKDIFRMSSKPNKTDLMRCMRIPKQEIGANDDLSFKISFDLDVRNNPELKDFTKILDTWVIETHAYDENIITITSPKLKYSEEGFKEVKIICNLLKKYHCQPYWNTNLKIKFNFDYFKTYAEFCSFIMLYLYSENVLNYICNKEGQGYIEGKTQPFSCLLRYLHDNHYNYYLPGNLRETIERMNSNTDFDNYSLSLLNCLTDDKMLEFKMADTELDFDELSKTIVLFAKLMEKGKFLANILKKRDLLAIQDQKGLTTVNLRMLVNCLREHKSPYTIKNLLADENVERFINDYASLKESDDGYEKLNLLLKILFDTESTLKYRNRFYDNVLVSGRAR